MFRIFTMFTWFTTFTLKQFRVSETAHAWTNGASHERAPPAKNFPQKYTKYTRRLFSEA